MEETPVLICISVKIFLTGVFFQAVGPCFVLSTMAPRNRGTQHGNFQHYRCIEGAPGVALFAAQFRACSCNFQEED